METTTEQPQLKQTMAYRNYLTMRRTLMRHTFQGIDTTWKTFDQTVQKFPNNNFLGTFNHNTNEYIFRTYADVHKDVINCANGIVNEQLLQHIENDDGVFNFIGVFASNRDEWAIIDLASAYVSATIVGIGSTFTDKQIEFILRQTKLTTLVLDADYVARVLNIIKDKEDIALTTLVICGSESDENVKSVLELNLNENAPIKSIVLFSSIIESGKNPKYDLDSLKATPDTIATFCYTSGSTGESKAAMISQGNIVASTTSINHTDFKYNENDVHYSYLPMNHIMERVYFHAVISSGASLGFGTGRVNIFDDLRVLRPTLFLGVPRVYQRICEYINEIYTKNGKINDLNKIFEEKLKIFKETGELSHSADEDEFFREAKEILGGRVTIMMSGSAPAAPQLLDFIKICFGVDILEGMGQTECTGLNIINTRSGYNTGHVGRPIVGAEVKLMDVPELGYSVDDVDEDGNRAPRGEILVKGPVVFKGYYQDKENTLKALDEAGFVHTGDVAQYRFDGTFKVIDRVKNIFKLSQGLYIAPELLENTLIKSEFVNQIYVHGDSLENYLIAIVFPEKEKVFNYFKENNRNEVTLDNVGEFYNDGGLVKVILKNLEKIGRENDFKGYEIIKNVLLVREPFSCENGLMTHNFKKKRGVFRKVFENDFKKLYGHN